jgi:uncharacterized cupredoxin-like copper-binding protein
MKHARIARATAVVAAFVLALGLTGAAFGAVTRQAAKVTVTFTDTSILVSRSSLEAGPATFRVVNNGQKLHTFTIMGPGVKGGRTQRVAPGATGTLTVTLRTGAYELLGPVGRYTTKARWLVVSPATAVHSTGNGSVTVPLVDSTGMNCD